MADRESRRARFHQNRNANRQGTSFRWTELMDQVAPFERPVGATRSDPIVGTDELTGQPIRQGVGGQRYNFTPRPQTNEAPSLERAKQRWTDVMEYMRTTSTADLFKDIGASALEAAKETYNSIDRVTRGGGNLSDLWATGGMAAGAGAPVAAPRGALRIFAGPRSSDPRLSSDKLDAIIARSKEYEQQGLPDNVQAEKLYEEFGVFDFGDRKPRVEITDYNAELTPKVGQFDDVIADLSTKANAETDPVKKETLSQKVYEYQETLTLGDILDHPELYQAYPDLKDFPVTLYFDDLSNTLGMAQSDGLEINLAAGTDAARSTLLHEIQHWVQLREGFDKGGNPDWMTMIINRPLPDLKGIAKTSHISFQTSLKNPELESYSVYYFQKVLDARRGIHAKENYLKAPNGPLKNNYELGFEIYQNLLGEVESRYVQARDLSVRSNAHLKGVPREEVAAQLENPADYEGLKGVYRNYSDEDIMEFIKQGVDPNDVPITVEE